MEQQINIEDLTRTIGELYLQLKIANNTIQRLQQELAELKDQKKEES